MLGFHWILTDELAGSPQPGLYGEWDNHVEYMRNNKITHVMSLTEEPLIEDEIKSEGFGFYHFPIRDMDKPMPVDAYKAVSYLKSIVDEGGRVLIHCKGGVGRTGMIAACYLVAKGYSPDEAVKFVRVVHPPYIQTRSQEQFVTHYAEYHAQQKSVVE